jgi:DNA recombination protein RmuC
MQMFWFIMTCLRLAADGALVSPGFISPSTENVIPASAARRAEIRECHGRRDEPILIDAVLGIASGDESMIEVLIVVLLLLLLAAVAIILYRILKEVPDRTELARLQAKEEEQQRILDDLLRKALLADRLAAEKARLESDLENERRATDEKIALLHESEARLKTQFENLANRIFEEKGRFISEQNRERISDLLRPFKDQLDGFRQRIDEINRDDTERSARLIEQVRHLQEFSTRVSEEANNLARAIKGEAKKQGDWGELIVERIFEASGLERGREFDIQVAMRAEDGTLRRPDFVVYLPGDKAVIVDSKVSLTAFERYCRTDHPGEREKALTEHVRSVRSHLQELKAKQYGQLLGNRTLDFVILCIPLEPAYQAALQNDQELLYDLAKTSVVITGPTTLMITLKLIAQIWRRENENRNAELIADRGGRLYDQVVLVAEAVQDAQRKVGGLAEALDLTMKRISEGKGNLVGRVEEIRRLGAKVNKQMPPPLAEKAVSEDGGA